jgi:hypothetical protein
LNIPYNIIPQVGIEGIEVKALEGSGCQHVTTFCQDFRLGKVFILPSSGTKGCSSGADDADKERTQKDTNTKTKGSGDRETGEDTTGA